ncbi:aminotransferase class I/II-fold pyridoxal phosphate-dependent enzyme [Salinibaculum marinum]|uniref:aminotransferase class I/II-fold pyridoxal phosphate-dependent enzyme n=1 Tax=Salinibaculum marinum TaxID=3131993 RepID=UPI003A96EED0
MQGPKVEAFEQKWAEYCGSDRAVAVSNGTVAIQLALNALGMEPGQEVIVPALTFGLTATAVGHQATFQYSPTSIATPIRSSTPILNGV